MRGGVDQFRAGPRSQAPAKRSSRRGAGRVCVMLTGVLAAAGLAACGSSSAGTSGPVALNFYNFPDPSGAVQSAVNNCSAQSHGKYTISYNKLQNAADQQRLQMARRLAAHDSSMDILGPGRHLGSRVRHGRLDQAVDRPVQGGGHQAERSRGRCRPPSGAVSSSRSRTTATPSCSGTAPTW